MQCINGAAVSWCKCWKTKLRSYICVKSEGCTHVGWLNFVVKEWRNARCLLVWTTQPRHAMIWLGLRRLKLHPMMYKKMASRSQVCNNLLPQDRSSQACPLRTCPWPPSVAWSVLRHIQIYTTTRNASRLLMRPWAVFFWDWHATICPPWGKIVQQVLTLCLKWHFNSTCHPTLQGRNKQRIGAL